MLAARLLAKTRWPKHELESVCEPLKQRSHKYSLASKRAGGRASVQTRFMNEGQFSSDLYAQAQKLSSA